MIADLVTIGGLSVAVAELALQAALHPWAAVTGVPAFEMSGWLPTGCDVLEVLPTVGFRARGLGAGRYLVRPVYWSEPGRSADPVQYDGIGVMRVRDGAWQLEVRGNVGWPIAFTGVLLRVGLDSILWGAVWLLLCVGAYAWARERRKTAYERLARGLEELRGRPTRG